MSGPSLVGIVRALGGDLYAGGRRANIPAPGHSSGDRSVSLLLSGDRVVVHGFGGADWSAALDDLRARGLVDPDGRVAGGPEVGQSTGAPPLLTRTERRACAVRLWAAAGPVEGTLSEAYARRRGIRRKLPAALRHHAAAPAAVYADRGPFRPALLAAVVDRDGVLCAVELTYLAADGRPARVKVPRKTVGGLPLGHAVRLDSATDRLLVAEGVFTALSASERFGDPAWALGSAGALAAWTPPPGVRSVVIAADRGAPGETAAAALARRLAALGLDVAVEAPPAPFGDWNDLAQAEAE